MKTGSYDLQDFLEQIQRLRRMRYLTQLLSLLPGYIDMERRFRLDELSDEFLKRSKAIVSSMTLDERRRPQIISATRLWRITRGSGTSARDVRELVERFWDARPPNGPDGRRYA